MFLAEYEKYCAQYEPGVKKVSIRSTFPKVDRIKIELSMEKSHGNYDLYFNQKGVLLTSDHFETHKEYKVSYAYNRSGKVVAIIQLKANTNELLEISEFSYDDKGRISNETIRSFEFNSYPPVISEYNYSYKGNFETLLIRLDGEDDDFLIYSTYNSTHLLLEAKAVRGYDEMLYWHIYEYDINGVMVKQISLDKNGNEDGLYEYLYDDTGMYNGCKYSSRTNNYLQEQSYQFNDKGYWISKILINDGEPKYFYDRTIEYY